MDSLQGYKTYFLAAVIVVLTATKYMGYVDDTAYSQLMALLGAGTAATLGAKINRVDKKLVIVPFLVLALALPVYAQSPPIVRANTPVTFAADHNGVETTHYNIMEGSVQKATVQVSALVNGVVTITVAAGFPKGNHTVVMQACGDGGCADSVPLTFPVVPDTPTAPTGLRIIR